MNVIDISFEGNPELRGAFAGKASGDECEMTVRIRVEKNDDKGLRGTILEAAPEDYDESEPYEEPEVAGEEGESAAMVALKARNANK